MSAPITLILGDANDLPAFRTHWDGPFSGSGTTLIAAAEEGCRAVGVEVDEGAYEAALRRIGRRGIEVRGIRS